LTVFGSQYLGIGLHVLAQSLLIPVIIGLLFFFVRVLLELGGLMGEWKERREQKPAGFELFKEMAEASCYGSTPGTPAAVNNLPDALGRVMESLKDIKTTDPEVRRILTQKFLEQEEEKALSTLDKTDAIARLGPMLGLMGTLIPLGPGLAALGKGDLTTLAAAIIIAFDTTVAGLAAGGLAFWISKTRRRWYARDLTILEGATELWLQGVNTDAAPAAPEAAYFPR